MAVYDEIEYWGKRQNPNCDNRKGRMSQEQIDENVKKQAAYVRKHIDGLDRILDLGPGVGRGFLAYSEVRFVEGFDISPLYKSRVVKESEKYDFKFTLTIGTRVGQLPYRDKEFDAGVAVSVLFHQRPVNIIRVMSELIRVSGKGIAISFYDRERRFDTPSTELKSSVRRELADHCYNYSYPDICDIHGWAMEDVVFPDSKGIYFVFREM